MTGGGGGAGGGDFQIVMGTGDVSSQSPLERLENVEKGVDEAIRRMEMQDRTGDSLQDEINTVKESLGRIEANMRELTSLYDLISSQVNPFIDVDLKGGGEGASEVAEFDALFEPTPEVAGEGAEGGKLAVEGDAAATGTMMEGPDGYPIMAPPEAIGSRRPAMGDRPLRIPRLTQIGADSTCLIALVRWIEFMQTRVRPDQIPALLSFYVRIGWVSPGIKTHVLDVMRGIRGGAGGKGGMGGMDAGKARMEVPKDKEGDVVMAYGKEEVHDYKPAEAKRPLAEDWKLHVDDHLKTLVFIERIRGTEVDKERLEELEREIHSMRSGLEGFFGL